MKKVEFRKNYEVIFTKLFYCEQGNDQMLKLLYSRKFVEFNQGRISGSINVHPIQKDHLRLGISKSHYKKLWQYARFFKAYPKGKENVVHI